MTYLDEFKKKKNLIKKYGESKAFLIWAMGMYLDYPDLNQLASESLTDGIGDKKIDFIRLDIDNKKITIVQGTYSKKRFYQAKANKASDLNTAIAWIFSGDTGKLRDKKYPAYENSLQEYAVDIRKAVMDNEVDELEILLVHNLAECQNVRDELETVEINTFKIVNVDKNNIKTEGDINPDIVVKAKELGFESLERIFKLKKANIVIEEKIEIPSVAKYFEEGKLWKSAIFTIQGDWLKDLYEKYEDLLFSPNYRGFLGFTNRGRKKINNGIKLTAEKEPENFWVYNNGITILTTKFYPNPENSESTIIEGISIINGAQTTGCIFNSDSQKLSNLKILCRIVDANDEKTVNSIIEYNNTQNEIKSWDRYSNEPEQKRIFLEFQNLGYSYPAKRGFASLDSELSIIDVIQPVSAFHGNYIEASGGKNNLFDKDSLYQDAFHNIKAKHLLLAFCLLKAIDERRIELKEKNNNNKCTFGEKHQLSLLRRLKFKYFLLSIIGDRFENIISESVNIRNVAFASGVVNSKFNSIDDLIDKCMPVVSAVLSYTTKSIYSEINSFLFNKAEYKKITSMVGDAIDNVKMMDTENIYTKFTKLIAPKG